LIINKESVHANTFIQIIAIQWISFQHVFKFSLAGNFKKNSLTYIPAFPHPPSSPPPRIPAFHHSRIHPFPHSPIPAFPHSRIPPFPHSRIPAFTHSRITPFPHSPIPAFPHSRIPVPYFKDSQSNSYFRSKNIPLTSIISQQVEISK
jgi:hypothetical protein